MTGKHSQNYNANYLNYVKMHDPPTKHLKNCAAAFGVGGLICCIGQFFRFMLEYAGLSGDVLAGSVSAMLIFLGCLLTGLGVYDRIGRYAGAGSIVAITGFANSVVSPALEFKQEGLILGTAAQMFTIAGPVIVYGTASSVIYGLIIYIFKLY